MKTLKRKVAMIALFLLLVTTPAISGQGWYLLVPYYSGAEPLGDWVHVSAYDTAKECEQSRLNWVKNNSDHFNDNEATSGKMIAVWSRCVASDDPRLVKGGK